MGGPHGADEFLSVGLPIAFRQSMELFDSESPCRL
jgi:hypothetical protein